MIPYYDILQREWPETTNRATVSSKKTNTVHVTAGLTKLDSMDFVPIVDRETFTTQEAILDKNKEPTLDENGNAVTKAVFDETSFNAKVASETVRQTAEWLEAVLELKQKTEEGVA